MLTDTTDLFMETAIVEIIGDPAKLNIIMMSFNKNVFEPENPWNFFWKYLLVLLI